MLLSRSKSELLQAQGFFRAFRDAEVFSALARDILGVPFQASIVHTEGTDAKIDPEASNRLVEDEVYQELTRMSQPLQKQLDEAERLLAEAPEHLLYVQVQAAAEAAQAAACEKRAAEALRQGDEELAREALWQKRYHESLARQYEAQHLKQQTVVASLGRAKELLQTRADTMMRSLDLLRIRLLYSRNGGALQRVISGLGTAASLLDLFEDKLRQEEVGIEAMCDTTDQAWELLGDRTPVSLWAEDGPTRVTLELLAEPGPRALARLMTAHLARAEAANHATHHTIVVLASDLNEDEPIPGMATLTAEMDAEQGGPPPHRLVLLSPFRQPSKAPAPVQRWLDLLRDFKGPLEPKYYREPTLAESAASLRREIENHSGPLPPPLTEQDTWFARTLITELCQAAGIELTDSQRERLRSVDMTVLWALCEKLERHESSRPAR